MDPIDLAAFLVIFIVLLVSGIFSAAEIGFLALGRRRLRHLAVSHDVATIGAGAMVEDGRPSALIERMLARPAVTLGVILVAITALNYIGEAVAASWVITRAGLPVWVAMVVMGALVVIFAETIPISYAAADPERVARIAAPLIWLASLVLVFPARLIGFFTERLAHFLGGHPHPEPPVTESQIRAIVDLQAEVGGLEEEEKVMIHQIFEFGDKVAREVMVPRTDMAAIKETASIDEAARITTERRVSRLPVYREDLDEIVGIVHVKDMLSLLASNQREAPVTSIMRAPFHVPATRRLSDLLTDFRRYRKTLAIVVDEYGGTAGLVTPEDLLEEVVGDIYDEHDMVPQPVERVSETTIILDGRVSIDEASEEIGVKLPEGDYDSIAGLLYSHLGVVPEVGQKLEFPQMLLTVEQLDGHRITRVQIERRPVGEEKSTGQVVDES